MTEIKLGVYSEKLVITEAAQQKYWPWIEAQISNVTGYKSLKG